MKKLAVIFPAAVLICFLTSCNSTGKALIQSQGPIALVSVVSNAEINWKDEDPTNTNQAGPLAKRALRRDPELTVASKADELIVTAERIFREVMSTSETIKFADRDRVFFSGAYGSARINRYQANRDYFKPNEYRFVDYRDKAFHSSLAGEIGVDKIMYVEFKFTISMALGIGKIGTLRAETGMNINIQDARGKSVFRKAYTLKSMERIRVRNGVYSYNELMDIFEPTIEEICRNFLDDLQGY